MLLGAVAVAVAVAFAFAVAVAVAVADTFCMYMYIHGISTILIFSLILRLFFSSGAGACVVADHASALDCIVKPNSLEQANIYITVRAERIA